MAAITAYRVYYVYKGKYTPRLASSFYNKKDAEDFVDLKNRKDSKCVYFYQEVSEMA